MYIFYICPFYLTLWIVATWTTFFIAATFGSVCDGIRKWSRIMDQHCVLYIFRVRITQSNHPHEIFISFISWKYSTFGLRTTPNWCWSDSIEIGKCRKSIARPELGWLLHYTIISSSRHHQYLRVRGTKLELLIVIYSENSFFFYRTYDCFRYWDTLSVKFLYRVNVATPSLLVQLLQFGGVSFKISILGIK